MTTAVVFVPAGHVIPYAAQCLNYCAAKGYTVAGVVTGNWAAVGAMLLERAAAVVVVARPEHLEPDREPRLEIAFPAEDARADLPQLPSRRRRPHRI